MLVWRLRPPASKIAFELFINSIEDLLNSSQKLRRDKSLSGLSVESNSIDFHFIKKSPAFSLDPVIKI